MANIFNADFRDFLEVLRRQQVRYILVDGYSVILHGYSRTTGDMDVWVEKTRLNYDRLVKAFYLTAKRAAGRPRDISDLNNLMNQ